MNSKKQKTVDVDAIEPQPTPIETQMIWKIMAGSKSGLSKFDFSKLNVQILHINSSTLSKICDKYEMGPPNRTKSLLEEINDEFWDKDKLWVFLPIDFSKEVEDKTYFKIWQIIQLIYPSEIRIYADITFQLFDYSKMYYCGNGTFGFSHFWENDMREYFLYYRDKSIPEVNKFINIFIERYDHIKYIHSAFESYTNSYIQRLPSMSFLSLCISLESIIDGRNELNYRIRRNVAILVGHTKEDSFQIYENINKLYKLRSAIVHSGNFNPVKIKEFLPYFRCLVSRLIIEIILQNIKNIKDLNKILTMSGFGDYKKISKDYLDMKLNILCYTTSFTKIE